MLNLPGSIEKYCGDWLCFCRSIQYYNSVQLMTPELEKAMNFSAKSLWFDSFSRCHRRIRSNSSDEEKVNAAQKCFDEVIEYRIPINDVHSIYKPFSSGWFLNMTNDMEHPTICWHYDVYPKLKK